MQVLERLLIGLQLLSSGRLLGKLWKPQLSLLLVLITEAPSETTKVPSTHLGTRRAQGRPVKAGQHIDDHVGVQLDFILHQLGVLGVKRERVGGALAGLDGASEEVKAKNLHGEEEKSWYIWFGFFVGSERETRW